MPLGPPADADVELHHATTVSVAGKGIFIRGASGSGKSALALQLIALGARLVADDQTRTWREGGQVLAAAPASIHGQIEARGIGLLRLPVLDQTPLSMVVDLDRLSEQRLPDPSLFCVMGMQLPCFHRIEGPHLAPALLLLAQGAYLDPNDPI